MAPAPLTDKQQQVYNLLTDDKSPQDIAAALGVSKAAIYSHIRAIKEAGHPVPAKYANVGTGGRGGRKAASKPSTAKRGASANGRRRNATKAPVPPAPVAAPAPAPEPILADGTVDVDGVFSGLIAQIQADQEHITTRRGQIAAEIASLEERKAALQAEDGDLEVAFARLEGTVKAIDTEPVPASANGNEQATLSGAAA
jgi:hypothetical protein